MKNTLFCAALSVTTVVTALSGCNENTPSTAKPSTAKPSIVKKVESDYETVLTVLTEDFIVPAYSNFEAKTAQLSQSIKTQCKVDANNSDENNITIDWQSLQQNWKAVSFAWQDISWLQIGPISSSNRLHRVQYWPDANNAVERGTQQLLSSDSELNLTSLAKMNVGAQGIPALERLIFQASLHQQTDAKALCTSLVLVSENLAGIASAVSTQWSASDNGFAQATIGGLAPFTNQKDALEELVSNVAAYISRIKDNKIIYPLSIQAPGIPMLGEAPFADSSPAHIQHNVAAIRAVLGTSDKHGLCYLLVQNQQQALASQLKNNLETLDELANQLQTSYASALADEEQRLVLTNLSNSLTALQTLLSESIVPALSLNLGFNSLDGD